MNEPDANCVTREDGECVSPVECMHGAAYELDVREDEEVLGYELGGEA